MRGKRLIMLKYFGLILISIILFLSAAVYLVETAETKEIKVSGIDKIEKTAGNKDGFSTEIYYLVYTDKGSFRIDMQGIFAHPEFTGRLKIDSVYKVKVAGLEAPIIGIWRVYNSYARIQIQSNETCKAVGYPSR